MARSLNQCSFIGNLGRDPEVRYLPSGGAVANMTIGVSDDYKDKNTGQMVNQTEWVRLTAYGKLAEVCGEYLKKGAKIFAQGKMVTRKWTDKQTGADKYSTEVVIDQMQMLDSRSGQQEQHGEYEQAARQRVPGGGQAPTPDDFDDSIPFN